MNKLEEEDLKEHRRFNVIKTPKVIPKERLIPTKTLPLDPHIERAYQIVQRIQGDDNWTREEFMVAVGLVIAFESDYRE